MKRILIVLALLAPGMASAYPNPAVTWQQSAGDMVNTMWTQPTVSPIVFADAATGGVAK